MQPAFNSALAAMIAAAPPAIREQLMVSSGYRSNDRQAELWAEALKKYGSPEAARKWVAPPGSSQHNHGNAADMKYASDAARQWAHANAAQFGLAFPLGNEPWHIELATARGGPAGMPAASMPGATMPQPQQQNAFAAPPTRPVNAFAQMQPVLLDPAAFMTSRRYNYLGNG